MMNPENTLLAFKKAAELLLSFINLKLRDFYGSLKQLCDDLDVKEQEITDKLAAIDYHYDEERNQFV